MLTKEDLDAIKTLIRDEVREIVREELEIESQSIKADLQGEIKLARIEIQQDVRELKNRVKNLEIQVSKIQKDIKSIVDFFDKEYLALRKRVDKLEEQQSNLL